jgi:urease accessory protein
LSQGTGLFWWEIVAPGREARGEMFQYECLDLKTEVEARGRPVAAEHVRLEPNLRGVSSLARLGPYRYFATFYICRVGLFSPSHWRDIELQLHELAGSLTQRGTTLWGVSALAAEGVTVRCLAVHSCDVLPGLYAFWTAAKKILYGCEPVRPRKVR